MGERERERERERLVTKMNFGERKKIYKKREHFRIRMTIERSFEGQKRGEGGARKCYSCCC